jgi:hypothetical protein
MENINQEAPKKKPFYKKWWVWVIGIFVLFIIIGASGDSSPQKVGENGTVENSQQQTVFKVGDQIKIKDTVLTVTDVNKNWKSSNQFDTPSNPGDVYVVVTLSLENQGSKQIDLSGFWDFKLQDGNGLIHDQGLGGIGLTKLSTGSLAPGGKTSGDIIFDVPQDATSKLTLHYEPLFSFSDPVTIELQ